MKKITVVIARGFDITDLKNPKEFAIIHSIGNDVGKIKIRQHKILSDMLKKEDSKKDARSKFKTLEVEYEGEIQSYIVIRAKEGPRDNFIVGVGANSDAAIISAELSLEKKFGKSVFYNVI